jgi:hypothetical protein
MNATQLTFPLPGSGPAVLTLPQPLPPEALLELEYSLATALRSLQHENCPDAQDVAQIEYSSWLALLGAGHH